STTHRETERLDVLARQRAAEGELETGVVERDRPEVRLVAEPGDGHRGARGPADDALDRRLDTGRRVVDTVDDRRGQASVVAQRHRVRAAEVTQGHVLLFVDVRLFGRDVRGDLVVAALRPVRIAVRLQVVLLADARVRHDRRTTARLDRRRAVAV